ncbi:MAG: hypothetical protein RMM17_09295 [Acidobacteriota bacterium]|nr:hypothetical protein [Blastocatellia bacterium]MDW8412863.1 hypothetical protein [Acidobacteriota bacterium]
MTALEGFLIGAISVLILVIVVLLVALLNSLRQMRAMAEKFREQLMLQTGEVQKQLTTRVDRFESMAKPVMEDAQRLLISARPAIERLPATLEAATTAIEETRQVISLAKDSAALARDAAAVLRVETESCLAAFKATASELTNMTKEEAELMRQTLADVRKRALLHIDRMDAIVGRTTDRIDETVAMVQTGIIRPVHEIAAILAGIQTFLEVLFAQERKTIDKAYQDEEMFI